MISHTYITGYRVDQLLESYHCTYLTIVFSIFHYLTIFFVLDYTLTYLFYVRY